MTASVLQAVCTVNGLLPDPPTGDASFSINVVGGSGNLFAPYHLYLRADSFVGFAVEDIAPDDFGYDPTQHDIQYQWFGLADEEYVPTQTPNLPNIWRNPWEASGRQVAGIWMLPGTKTVTCFAYDSAGNWAFASHSFTIEGEDALYPGDLNICISATGSTAGAPAGAVIVTTTAAAWTAAVAIRNRADTAMRRPRILFNRGETFAAPDWQFGFWGANAATVSLTIGAYGSGSRPIIDYTAGGGQFQFMNSGAADAPRHVIRDIEFRGPWRAWEEVGELQVPFGDGSANNIRNHVLIARCLFTGFSGVPLGGEAPFGATGGVMMFDNVITNWANYGVEFTHPRSAFIWCDFHQHEDALNGIAEQGATNQTPVQFGNRHGPFRGGRNEPFVNCCSMFSRNGWSNSSVLNYVNWPPSFVQNALRWNQPASDRRGYGNVCKVTLEGGGFSAIGGVTDGTVRAATFNLHMDRILIIGNWTTTGGTFYSSVPETTVRNIFIWWPNTPVQHNALIERDFWGEPAAGSFRVHNCTILNGLQTSRLASGYQALQAGGAGTTEQANNVFRIAGRSIGGTLDPLGASPFVGFACRDKGARWNFRPAIVNVSSARELGPGDVAVGEWVFVPYPNHTGQNNGAGAQVTRSMVDSTSRKHVVSVSQPGSGRQNMTATAHGGNGRVVFEFTDTGVRVQNNNTLWPGGANIWVQFDMADRLMDFLPGTSTAGLVPPMPIPGSGSSALASATTGRRALADIAGTRRPGTRTNDGMTIGGTASQGAFEPT